MDDELFAYEAMVMELGLMGQARARLLSQRITGGFSLDLDKGIVRLGGVGSFPVHLLGTYSYHSETFLWAWANAGTQSLEVTGFARGLRERGAAVEGLAAFTKPQFGLDYVNPSELANVCGELAGFPSFCGTDEHGEVYLVVETDIEVHVSSPRWLHELLVGFQSGLPEGSTVDVRACVKRFLERCSFSVEETVSGLRFSGEGFPLTDIELDWRGRVSAVSAATGPTRSKADAPQPSPAPVPLARPRTAAVEPRLFVARMTPTAKRILEAALIRATTLRHPDVEIVHVLESILLEPGGDVAALFAEQDLDIAPLARRVTALVDAIAPTRTLAKPFFSTHLFPWISDAWVEASLQHGAQWIRTGHLFYRLAHFPDRYLATAVPELDALDLEPIVASLSDPMFASSEAREAELPPPRSGGSSSVH